MKIIGSAGGVKDNSRVTDVDHDHHSSREVQREKQIGWGKGSDKFCLSHFDFEMSK